MSTSTSTSTSMSTSTETDVDVDVTKFDTLVICPECSAAFIGKNIYERGTCWFFNNKNPLCQAVVVGLERIQVAKKEAIRVEKTIQVVLQTNDKTATHRALQKKIKAPHRERNKIDQMNFGYNKICIILGIDHQKKYWVKHFSIKWKFNNLRT